MKLENKVFVLGQEVDLEQIPTKVLVNGEDKELTLKDIFKKIEFEEGKLVGYSILQFYKVKDGSLIDGEGNIIEVHTDKCKIPILKVRDPIIGINSLEVSRNYVRDVGKLLNLDKTEETITALSPEDKKFLQDERDAYYAEVEAKKEETKKAIEEKEASEKAASEQAIAEAKAKEDAKATEEAKIAQEAEEAKLAEEAKSKIPEDAISLKEYKLVVRKFQRMGFNKYAKGNYHFFYGDDRPDGELPFILLNKEKYFLELDGSLVHEGDNDVEYEFSDEDGVDKILTLKEGVVEISDL